MTQILIDNQRIDYNDSDLLPFIIEFKTDPFFEIGTSTGYELVNLANRLNIEPTANNLFILKKGLQHLTAQANGKRFFTGKSLNTTVSKNGSQITGLSLAVFGGNFEFFHLFNDLYLNQLDLGTETWSDAAIQSSWQFGNGHKGVFAPVIYGQLQDTNPYGKGFVAEALRFHVFFYDIAQAIFQHVGYRLDSPFMESNFFKHIVFLYATGQLKAIDPLKCHVQMGSQTTFATNTNLTFNNIQVNPAAIYNNGEFTIPHTVPIRLLGSIVTPGHPNAQIQIFRNGLPFADYPTGSFDLELDANKGDIFTFQLTDSSANIDVYGISNIQIQSNRPFVGDDFEVSSCLPKVSSKVFLRDLTKLFNLVWQVNTTNKTVQVAPRFDWNGQAGFYQKPTQGSRTLDLADRKTIQHDISRLKSYLLR